MTRAKDISKIVTDANLSGTLDVTGDLTVDTNTLYVDSTNNRVGIGTTSPLASFETHGQSRFASSSTSAVMVIDADATSTNGINIQSSYYGGAGYGPMKFTTGGTERMRVTSDGYVLVGTTAVQPGIANTSTGISLTNNNIVVSSRASGATGIFNVNTDGEIIQLRKSGTTAGSIGVDNDTDLVITATDDIFFNVAGASNNILQLFGGSSANSQVKFDSPIFPLTDNTRDIGNSAERWKDLYLSGGVYLGGTGSANYLDDYEEGSGNLTITGTSGGTATTSGSADYQYTKIGNLVSFQFEFNCSSVSGVSGTLQIALPFTPSEYSVGALRGYLVTFDGSPFVQTTQSVSQLRLEASKTGSITQSILSTGYYIGEITYKTTA